MSKDKVVIRRSLNTVVYILVVICTLLSLFPTVYALILAMIKESAGYQMYENPAIIFQSITLENFKKVFEKYPIMRWTLNSFIVAVSSTVLYTFIASLAAFSFSRLRYPGRKIIFTICLSSMLIPGVINIVPNNILIREMGLYNSLLAMIPPGLGGVGGVFLIKQFMDNIPKDFDEIARVDGASNFRIYWSVILPMCKPVLIAQAVFSFQGAWNDFLWPIIVTDNSASRTLAAGLYIDVLSQAQYRGLVCAASIISAIPIIVLYIFGQKYFTQGVGRGGLKR